MDNQEIFNNLRKLAKAESRENFKYNSKERVKKIAGKKFNTCFIFPISEFENVFGELWGHGLLDNQLNDQQKLNRKKWEQIRRNILDKGNLQRRAFESELELYNIEYCGYKADFVGGKND